MKRLTTDTHTRADSVISVNRNKITHMNVCVFCEEVRQAWNSTQPLKVSQHEYEQPVNERTHAREVNQITACNQIKNTDNNNNIHVMFT